MPATVKEKSPLTVIELDENFVKLCQAQKKDGKTILRLFVKKILPAQHISAELKMLIKESKLDTNYLALVLPREQLIVRFLTLPSIDISEISQMMEYQLKQQIPYPKEEIVSDFIVLNTFPDRTSSVMLVAVHSQTLYKYIKYLEEINLRPRLVTFSSEGVLRWYEFLYMDKEKPNEKILLIDIDFNYAEVLLIQNKELLFTRSISISSDNESILNELVKTIHSIPTEETSANISKIVLKGETDTKDALFNMLKERFSIPAELVSPLGNLTLKDYDSYNRHKPEGVSVSSVIGISFTKNKPLINLIPRQLQDKWDLKDKKTQILKTLILIGGVLACLISIATRDIYEKKRYQEYLEYNIKNTGDEVMLVQSLSARLEFIKHEIKNKSLLLDIIGSLYTVTPSNIYLIDFTYDEDDKVTLRGNARAMNNVFEFSNILEKLPYFKAVKIKYVTEKKMPDRETGLNFELICQL